MGKSDLGKAASSARHGRETMALAAAIGGSNRETVRKARIVKYSFIDANDAIMSGTYSVEELFRLATGDRRVGLHVLVAPEIREAMNQEARRRGMTRQEMLAELLTQIFGYGEA